MTAVPPDREPVPVCARACCAGNEFGERSVRRDVARYHRDGPDETTRWLIDGLRADGVQGMTVLDIGAGIGAVHLALLADGAASAVDVDGSPAFVTAATAEAARQGVDPSRVRRVLGDFVQLAGDIEAADVVALDRVVCCYPDMEQLVSRSAERARRRYGLVYPRDAAWIRLGGTVFNAFNRLFRQRLRMYIHRSSEVERVVVAAGFTRRSRRTTRIWQVVIFERA